MVPGEAPLFIQREAMPTVKDTYFAGDARGFNAGGEIDLKTSALAHWR
jgi:hypothetical protein